MVTVSTVAAATHAVMLSGRLLADTTLAKSDLSGVHAESAAMYVRLLREQLDEIEAALTSAPAEKAA